MKLPRMEIFLPRQSATIYGGDNGSRTLEVEIEAGDAGSDIQSGLHLDAKRLQRNCFLEPPDQDIGTQASDDCGLRARPDISALERATSDLARRKHRPSQD